MNKICIQCYQYVQKINLDLKSWLLKSKLDSKLRLTSMKPDIKTHRQQKI